MPGRVSCLDWRCPQCGKRRWLKPSYARTKKYCSRLCQYAASRVKHPVRLKQSAKHRFGQRICDQCQQSYEARSHDQRFCSHRCVWTNIQERRQGKVDLAKHPCESCGKPFRPRPGSAGRFCSRACADGGWTEPCTFCGKPVHCTPSHAHTQKHIFCSRKCYSQWRSQKVSRICKHCGKEFSCKPSKIAEGKGNFCSQVCYDASRAQIMTTCICEQCGEPFKVPSSFLNKSMYQGRFCSTVCSALSRRLPESTRSVYSHEFTDSLKEEIRARDNHMCQLCGLAASKHYRALDVHHINYDKTHNELSNLLTLCSSCHSRTNYRRTYWRKRLERLMTHLGY